MPAVAAVGQPGPSTPGTMKYFKYKEFMCGWGAGCFETIMLFPIYKVIFRQQLYALSLPSAVKQIKGEGFVHLYRGLAPPLMMRTTSRALMFGMYDKFQGRLSCPSGSNSLDLCHAQAAFLAGTCEALLCPFERVQTLLQTTKYTSLFKNTGEAMGSLYTYGWREYYRGFSVIVARNGLSNALFFTLREPFRQSINESNMGMNPKILRLFADFCSGGVLGASISTLFFPMNVVKNRMQSRLGTSYDSPFKVFGVIWHERQGWKELYRGVHLNVGRSLFGWGITNAVYESLRRQFD